MFLIKFFWRDFKSDLSFNGFTLLCTTLGLMGLLLVESFKTGIEEKVSKNAKNFIASDLSISARRAFDTKEIFEINQVIKQNKITHALWVESYSLISKIDINSSIPLAKLADLNFVTDEFPFYGGLSLEDRGFIGPGSWSTLHNSPKAWISRDLSWELGIKKNDSIKIGEASFVVDGIITEDKFSSFRGFSLAPKIYLSHHFLKKTELIKFGSTASFSYIFKLKDNEEIKKIQNYLRSRLPDRSIKIVGPEESSQQLSRSLVILADYLGLITLMTYMLSLVGLFYFTQHFLSKKLKVLSIYKALGIKTETLFIINFLHLIILTSASVFLSTSTIQLILPFLTNYFSQLVGDIILFKIEFGTIIRVLFLSLGGSLFSLGPLFWGALQTPVATVFQDLPAELSRIKNYYFAPLLIFIILLVILLSNSFKVAGLYIVALITILFLSALIFKGIALFLNLRADRFNLINRHAIKTLVRYFSSSFTIFICLLIGMTLTIYIFQLDTSLRREFTQNNLDKRPDIFLFDLQDSQADVLKSLVAEEKWKLTMLAPMIRGRLLKINDENFQQQKATNSNEFTTREEQSSEQLKNRGVNLSYRSTLSWSEKIVNGQFNGSVCHPEISPCEISLEENYAKRLNIKLGDKLFFDISGTEISGIVTSFRKVNWISFEPNFFILFQPGTLEDAPKTYLSSFKINNLIEKRSIFSKISIKLPNVSLLDVSETVKKITTLFDLMALAIKLISSLSLAVALIVLMAISFNHLDLRKRDMSLFSIMGLKKEFIHNIYSREFALLISLCLILSLFFGSTMTIITMRFIFDTEAVLRLPFTLTVISFIGLTLYLGVYLRINILLKNKEIF